MKPAQYLILGGGPSGLTVAHALIAAGIPLEQVVVIEAETEPGGLCRSTVIDGSPLDIGGGHFLDVRRREVLDFLFRFMPAEEWNTFGRVAKIRLRKQEIDHPLEANLWQFTKEDQVDYLESIAQAGAVRGETMPESFADWVRWKFGERIAEEYMLPYNRKMWSMSLETLGTYWLYKLPNVSFRETLRSCLEARPFGALPAHGTFLYPKTHGYGEVWRRMGKALGDSLILGCPVTSIDIDSLVVNDCWKAETVISSVPWTIWPRLAGNLPPSVIGFIDELRYTAVDVDYHHETQETNAHWIYEPREDIGYHRILARSNFSAGAVGYWTEANDARSEPQTGFRHHNKYAYPVNTLGKPAAVNGIVEWARGKNIIGLGRWGTWEHMNSDVAVAEALALARKLTQGAFRA